MRTTESLVDVLGRPMLRKGDATKKIIIIKYTYDSQTFFDADIVNVLHLAGTQ